MDKDQAINYLRSLGMSEEQIDTVVKAFTCEDAISRQAAISHLTKARLVGDSRSMTEIFAELPPVQNKAKTGKWIKFRENCREYKCSICESENCKESNYCPNCGAKMESEEVK